MFYAPHTIYKTVHEDIRDEYKRLVESVESEILIGECRCDDNTTVRFETENGKGFIPKYHIVCDRTVEINEGDKVIVYDADNAVRGMGEVFNVRKCNFLDYAEIWV